jgi:sigma-B regulation protein RsbQ
MACPSVPCRAGAARCKDADMGEIRAGGRNNVVLAGRDDKPVMMLANGFGCDQNMWRLIAPGLAEDYRVVLFDHVGSGGSDLSAWRADRYAVLDGYADDILLLCHELRLQRVVLVAHSVSAMMAVLAAIREPGLFSKLILIGPSPRYVDDAGYRGGFSQADIDDLLGSLDSNYLGWSAAMAPVIMGNPERPALGEELANSFCRTDPEIARAFARTTFLSDNRSDLHRVTVPTLILQCSRDVIAPPEVGDYVKAQIPGSTLVTLPATGHCPQLSAPEVTLAAIRSFAAADGGERHG